LSSKRIRIPELDDGVTGTAGGRQEPHHAHQGEEYHEIAAAVDRTHPFGDRARVADARAVAENLRDNQINRTVFTRIPNNGTRRVFTLTAPSTIVRAQPAWQGE